MAYKGSWRGSQERESAADMVVHNSVCTLSTTDCTLCKDYECNDRDLDDFELECLEDHYLDTLLDSTLTK